jgi:glycosyltransferase involved in cell wall biosynthesis
VRVSRTANLGFPASLGRAITESTGEYIALLDADDYFAPRRLERLRDAFRTGAEFVVNDHFVVDENGEVIEQGEGGQTSTIAFRRDLARRLLPVNNELPFHIIGRAFGGRHLEEPLTCYRVHAASMTKRDGFSHAGYFADRFRDCHRKCRELAHDVWPEKRRELLRAAAEWRTEEVRERINERIALGDRAGAVRLATLALGRVLAEGTSAFRIARTMIRGWLWGLRLHWRYK